MDKFEKLLKNPDSADTVDTSSGDGYSISRPKETAQAFLRGEKKALGKSGGKDFTMKHLLQHEAAEKNVKPVVRMLPTAEHLVGTEQLGRHSAHRHVSWRDRTKKKKTISAKAKREAKSILRHLPGISQLRTVKTPKILHYTTNSHPDALTDTLTAVAPMAIEAQSEVPKPKHQRQHGSQRQQQAHLKEDLKLRHQLRVDLALAEQKVELDRRKIALEERDEAVQGLLD